MSVESVYGFLGDRLVIGPGSVVQLGPIEGANAIQLKLLSGGTLEVGGYSLTTRAFGFTCIGGTATRLATVGQTFGVLYPISANEIFAGNYAGKIYLYASSATCTVAVNFGQSQGY